MDSYGNPDPSCADLENARSGMKTFLGYMDPSIDRVGLAVLPPAASLSKKCNQPSTNSYVEYDSATSKYVIVPLSTDYKLNNALNTSSSLVSTINCVKGAAAPRTPPRSRRRRRSSTRVDALMSRT